MLKASLIHVSKDLLQAVNKELYSFIWKGKDKVRIYGSCAKNDVFEEVY